MVIIGTHALENCTVVSFEFGCETFEEETYSGQPWMGLIGAKPKKITLRAIYSDRNEALALAGTIYVAQEAKQKISVSGLPSQNWDGEYYVSLSMEFSASYITADLVLEGE